MEKDVCAVAAWDSSIQDNVHLNKVTEGKQKLMSSPLLFLKQFKENGETFKLCKCYCS